MSTDALSVPADSADDRGENVWTTYSTRERTLLTLGAVGSYLIFGAIGKFFAIPQLPHYQASLLAQPNPLIAVVIAGVTLVACVLLCTLITGRIHFEAGLFCAAIGMVALSTRGGPMRYVLMYSSGPGVFLRLAFETVLLFGCIAVGWYVLLIMRDNNLLHGEPLRDDDPEAMPMMGLMALGAQVIVMIFLLMLLVQTDKKAQCTWSIAIAALLSTLLAHSLFPARPSIWFWSGPFVVALIGYVFAWSGGGPLVGGDVGGMLPQLGRPLPLDYAALGTAGAMMGYWTSRSWQHERENEPDNPDKVEEALDQRAAG
ncbi:MAG: hypothetical protein QOF78_4378 [Phycisphaerales bacterium]|jgi:hypothetical protein|nr:hypothetical protein [Phycisphaerales bacterium]